tara:strand:- start:3142 stop:3261 length:120 start_codon:yes stop_codon:yes gene_type:complete
MEFELGIQKCSREKPFDSTHQDLLADSSFDLSGWAIAFV